MAATMTLAVLMTCHNRRETTLRCLRSLSSQVDVDEIKLEIFLVDDASTDGTAAAVKDAFPRVTVIKGDGTLYWNGGMRKAISAASRQGFDSYLLLNDDTQLVPDALNRLFRTSRTVDAHSIIVGSLCDPDTSKVTYGGSRCISRLNPLRVELVEPSDRAQRCDVFNGNVVLIPQRVLDALGNLSQRFRHRSGDYEFALRAKKAGISAWIAPGYVGQCRRNPVSGTWRDPMLPAKVRIAKFLAPTGSPVRERLYLLAKFGGPLWPYYFVSAHVRFLVSLLRRKPG